MSSKKMFTSRKHAILLVILLALSLAVIGSSTYAKSKRSQNQTRAIQQQCQKIASGSGISVNQSKYKSCLRAHGL